MIETPKLTTTAVTKSDLPLRPGYGTSGRKIQIRTNFFPITTLPTNNIHHYDVSITPDVPPAVNKLIYQTLMSVHSDKFQGITPVFDGRKNSFSCKPLPFGASFSIDVTLPEERKNSKRPPREFKVTFKKVNEINMEELYQFLNGHCSVTPNCLTAIMALDILFRYKPSLTHFTVARSFYTSQGAKPISGGLEVWQGYYQSCRPGFKRMFVNIDTSATAFYAAGSLIDFVKNILNLRHIEDLRRGLRGGDLQKVKKALKGITISVSHRGENSRKFKIQNLTDVSTDKVEFNQGEESDAKKVKLIDYFKTKYNLRLSYPFLPCVVVQKDNKLPMEVCNIVGGQRFMKKLGDRQTADMIKITCQPPHVRSSTVSKGYEMLNYGKNEFLNEFGINVGKDMVQINARVLNPPRLSYHKDSRDPDFVPEDGAWNLRDKKVAQGATLESWCVIVYEHDKKLNTRIAQNFVRELCVTCQATGMNIPSKQPDVYYHNPQGDIEVNLKKAFEQTGNKFQKKPQMMLCVLPNTGTPLYAEIKRVSDTVIGIATQCVQSKHVLAAKKQYCANVCLKINVKLGGMNSFLSASQTPFISQVPTIIFGADVTHPGPGDMSRPSIASLVASMDSKASRYASCIRYQATRDEIITDFAGMVMEMLRAFYRSCGQKPKRVLVYRDGVSEGMFSEVSKTEIASIKSACERLQDNYCPLITFVVVHKRHHARFFPKSKSDADRSGNCKPGTVVETEITHPREFDFYLQSHSGLQGTSRSAHYHVLFDDNNFTPDDLQQLTFKLCYLFARCTRSVSLVPPVYYAHLVAERARFHSKSANWSDTESDVSAAADVSNYKAVKESLQKVMYFM